MADVNANIGVNIDTSEALAQLKALQRQISQFHTSIAKSSEAAALAQRDLQRNFINSVNAIGSFSAELRTVKTTAESFTDSLQKNKFSMREYFRYAGASTKTFGKLFKSEFETIGKVAEDRVKKLQTQYIKLGRDTNGAMKAIAIIPNELDMSNFSTQTQIAAQRQALFNQLMKQGSTNLLNFGKNTQWAGRQLMVGFTLPLATLGTTAAKTFMDMEAAALKFRKVYGDLFTPREETQQALDDVTALGQMFTKYGVAVSQTVSLAADAAAAGFQGLDLQRQVTEATRLQVLGQIDQQKALETTISLQNAFKLSNEDLTDSINFLNAVENQTVVSLDDITTAIPKVAPVIMQLGGNVRDLAFFLTAMKEGGINASEGANALKSGLASLINPTEKASKMLADMGININNIVEKNQGNLRATVIEFAQALDTLEPLSRARAIEQLFGKFQFARLSTLFDNVTSQTNQAARVLDLAGSSIEDLADLSESELGMTADSAMNKFRKSVEEMKLALVPVGETFLKAVTPIVEFIGNILEKFNGLSEGVKKAIVVMTVAIGAIGPVALMTFGLLANGLANIVKGAMVLRNGYLRLTGQTQILGEQTDYLTMEQINAAAASHSLDQSHAKLTQTFTAEVAEINKLIQAYQSAANAAAKFAVNNPGMMRTPKKMASGGMVVGPGSGTSDSVPTMLSNGEAVIPARVVKKYPELVQGLIAGNIPGFVDGYMPKGLPGASDFAHITNKAQVEIGKLLVMLQDAPKTLSQSMMATLRELAMVFGEELKVFIYSGLGFTQSKALNIGMADGGAVSAKDFLKDFESQGLAKWNTSLKIAGVKTQDVAEELEYYNNALIEGIRSIEGIDNGATITSDEFAKMEREIRATLPEFSQLRKALDIAEQSLTEIRFNINEKTAVGAGLELFQVPSKKDPTKMSKKKKVQLPSGKNIRLGGEHLVGRSTGGIGVIDASTIRRAANEVTSEVVLETARAAGTQSPSKKTIPIGEDIGRGLQVGMENQQDEVAMAGAKLGEAAVGGTQSGIKRRRVATRGQSPAATISTGTTQSGIRRRGRAQSQGGTPEEIIARNAITVQEIEKTAAISEKTKEVVEKEVAARKVSVDKITKMNTALMSGTFALTSLAGAGSFFDGVIGDLSQQVFKYSGILFALMSVTQMLTQAKIVELATTRANTIASAMGGKNFKALIAGAAGFGAKLLTASKFFLRFLGPIGLFATGLIATISIIKSVNAARERERLAIEGLGDAALLATDQVKSLGDFFGVRPTTTRLERSGPSLILGKDQRSQVDELRASAGFQKDFAKDIQVLRGATDQQAKIVFDALQVQLKGKGFAQEQVRTIIRALQEESGKTKLDLNFAGFDFATEAGQQDLKNLADTLGRSFGKQFSTGYSEETKTAVNRITGEIVSFTDKKVSKGLQKSVSTTSKTIAGLFNGLSGQIENQLITAEQFNQSFANISETIENMPEPQSMFLLDNILKNMPGDLAKTAIGIKNVSDQLLIAKAAALGVSTITPEMVKQLKAASTSLDARAGLAAGRVRAKIKEDMKIVLKMFDTVKAELDGVTGGKTGGTGEKSAFQIAMEQLIAQRKEIMNNAEAYKRLRQAGVDAGKAFTIAKDPILAAALATTKVGTDNWNKLLGLINEIEQKSKNKALTDFLASMSAENQPKLDLLKIGPQLQELGATAQEIEKIMGDPNLIGHFIDRLKAGKSVTEGIKATLDKIRESEGIDIKVKLLTVEGMQDQFDEQKAKVMEYFDVLEREANAKFKKPIQEAEKAAESAAEAVKTIQDEISALQDKSALVQRQIEETVNRPLEELQQRSAILSETSTLIDKQAELINEKYDAQAKALSLVSEINQDIIGQEKQRISIADALTQGDIAAAAQAAQDMRASAAEKAAQRSSEVLDVARQRALDNIVVNGMTQKQIKEEQYNIERQSFALEQSRLPLTKQIQDIEDEIYSIQVGRLATAQATQIEKDKELQKQKDLLQTELDGIDAQRQRWEAAQLAIDGAKVRTDVWNTALNTSLSLVNAIVDKWNSMRSAPSAPTGGGGGATSPSITNSVAKVTDAVVTLEETVSAITPAKLASSFNNSIAQAESYVADQLITSTGLGARQAGMLKGMLGMSSGGLVPKYMAKGGLSRGTDSQFAMLTPGEFVVKKYAVDNFGVDKLNAINNGTYDGKAAVVTSVSDNSNTVYNYSVGITVGGTNSNADAIAKTVLNEIKYIDSQRIRGQRA